MAGAGLGLTERLTAHQRGWLVLREDGGCGALLGPEGLLWGDLPKGVGPASLQTDCVRQDGLFSMPLPIGERALLFGRATSRRPCVPCW